jgi:hypothetical protein
MLINIYPIASYAVCLEQFKTYVCTSLDIEVSPFLKFLVVASDARLPKRATA